ncbi:SspB family protein [Cognatishimia activa]|uniref:Stringent starvation protein B n=1 Tax=Cognatishimia activa TaxID=1715691 RepID=A0A0P1JBU7_9RHOB|nr:ClpXP protease specificity-enhancing factor SspB [Cognatishimia activa]CUJ29175.1 Stringent starvation protein B [Cognatishimia activa]CUK27246.1 Stringent starvation protein B [Cognatishimia activa]
MTATIDYGNLMHRAMRGLIQEVLEDVRDNGLPGEHHFFITFDTQHPDVQIADWLSDRYPGEMTVVMQHWFDNLTVTEEGFAVTLNFGDAPEPLYIPYDAIKTFVDPSVEFGLRFETQESDDDEDDVEELAPVEPIVEDVSEKISESLKDKIEEKLSDTAPGEKKDADVVSLDSFRKT